MFLALERRMLETITSGNPLDDVLEGLVLLIEQYSEDTVCCMLLLGEDGRALARLLREHGFEVELFSDGESLLTAQSQQPSDCILIDLQMSKMDGFAVLQQLGAEEVTRIPVIIVTGRDLLSYRQRAASLGASDYLTKPVDEILLLNAIRSCLVKG